MARHGPSTGRVPGWRRASGRTFPRATAAGRTIVRAHLPLASSLPPPSPRIMVSAAGDATRVAAISSVPVVTKISTGSTGGPPSIGELNSAGGMPDIRAVTTPTRQKPGRPRRPRSRYGYDHHWWGEPRRVAVGRPTRTGGPPAGRCPAWLSSCRPDRLRGGGDLARRAVGRRAPGRGRRLGPPGLAPRPDRPLAPAARPGLGPARLAGVDRRDWRFHPASSAGMLFESLMLGVALVGLSKLVDLGFARLEGLEPPGGAGRRHPIAPVIGFLGAGLYEEALFRLALIPLLFRRCGCSMVPAARGLHAGDHGVVAALLAGPPRGGAGRGVHLVRVHLPMAGGGLLRLGVRGPGLRRCGRHAYGLRFARRMVRLAVLIRPIAGAGRPCGSSNCPTSTSGDTPTTRSTCSTSGRSGSPACSRVGPRFRLERLASVVERVRGLEADHVLITGDLTTTALPAEFDDARAALAALLTDPSRVTVIPGNHDRYTGGSVRTASSRRTSAPSPRPRLPLAPPPRRRTAILGLDPTRSHLSAKGLLPPPQLARPATSSPTRRTPPAA